MNKHISKLILIFFLLALSTSVSAQVKKSGTEPLQANQAEHKFTSTATKSKLTYKIIDATNKTFCYDIFADGKLMIHQPSVPGVPDNNGFKTKAEAEKVAQLVIKKIKNGEMPPSVTKGEMQKVGALK